MEICVLKKISSWIMPMSSFRPKRSTLHSRRDVKLKRTYKFKYSNHEWSGVPLMAANMDGVGELQIAEKMNMK